MPLYPSFFVDSAGVAPGYQIEQSLRFNSADSAYLNRTPGSAGNRKTWTWSGWVKRSTLGVYQTLFSGGGASPAYDAFRFTDTDKLQFFQQGATAADLITNAVFRDTSAWYHIVLKLNSTASEAAIFVNGVEQTVTGTQPTNTDRNINNTIPHGVGATAVNSSFSLYMSGYLAEVNFIDGSALDPTDFGEYDGNGVWRPIKYTGSYTGNSFYLKFASGDGTDSSGLSNTWTANNFTTSGTGTDVMSDTPTTNWATLNPLDSLGGTFFEGNLEFAGTYSSGGSQNGHGCRSTISVPSGKWYVEASSTTYSGSGNSCMLGFTSSTQAISASAFSTNLTPWIGVDASVYNNNVKFYSNGVSGGTASGTTLYSSYSSGDIINFAIDFDAGKFWVGKNGSYAGDPGAGTNPTSTFTPGDGSWAFWGEYVASGNDANRSQVNVNFGQRAFEYTEPSGFKALNTSNLPAPDIADGSDYFNTVLWTGDGASSRSITGVGFQPDWVWTKKRNSAQDHFLYDAVRGSTNGNFLELRSNSTAAENSPSTADTGMRSFDSNGFTIGSDGSVNTNNDTYVAWNWLAGGSGSSNTDGSITSTVSANPTAGFSIVSYTGTNVSGATVGHGLGVAPKMIIIKNRSSVESWPVYHAANTSAPETDYLVLNTTAATADATTPWNDTLPSSTVFTLGNWNALNENGSNHIAYCFAEVEGYSKFGSYQGNGNSDGSFIYTGFRPALVLIKSTTSAENWLMFDSARGPYNANDTVLWPNLSNAEQVSNLTPQDFLSNGFKLRTSSSAINGSGNTYIYMAFAENPFGGSGVSPATAR